MKRSVLLLTLLLTGSAAHAQYGGLINLGVGTVKDNLVKRASENRRQGDNEFVTTAEYDRRNFQKKRSPVDQLPPSEAKQIALLEQRLETCYQLLQASDYEPLLVAERSEDALYAIIRQVQLMRSKWSLTAYQSEIAFYRDQDRYRHGRALERAAALAAHQHDSTQVAARQRTAAADPLLLASPATAYLNVYRNTVRTLKTEPNEDGNTIATVASGSLLSILYRLPAAHHCYVYVDGIYGWMAEGDLVPTLNVANEVHQGDVVTRLAVRPGFVSVQLREQPALEAVMPSALAGVVATRAAGRAAEKARAEAAYAKANPVRVKVVYNEIVYVDADQYMPISSDFRVRLYYHALASCKLLRGARIGKLNFELLDHASAPVDLITCDLCGYEKPDRPRAATAKVTHTRATSGATHAKPGAKLHK